MSDEQRPLLGPTHVLHDIKIIPIEENRNQEDTPVTPLPMRQISILLLLQLAEPITASVIYPFIAQLVNETGVTGGDSSKVGYYAGLIESIFFLTESMFTLQYGRLSDRIGRRPVLMFGLFGLALSILSFGLSKTFIALVFSRALAGALNGNVGVAKSMIVELTDETNQAQCFSFMPIVWSVGCTLGPFLGGTLSHPAALFPRVFDTKFCNEYPYFLPCLVAAGFAACIFVVSAFFLQETLHTHTDNKTQTSPNTIEYGAVNGAARPTPTPAPPMRTVLTKRACIAIANYAALAFVDISYMAIVPIMFAASIENGGLGLEPRSIGLILGLLGIVTGVVQVVLFAPMHKRFGNKQTFVTGLTAYMLLTLTLPIMNVFARRGMMNAMWAVIGLNLLLSCLAFMAFACITIFVTSAAPTKNSLGTLNGISQMTISMIRAIGPATATSLFALSVDRGLLGGWLVYVVLIGVNVGGLFASRWLKEEKRAHGA